MMSEEIDGFVEMSANVHLPTKDLDESGVLDSGSITDSEKDDCSPEGSIVGERLRGDGQEQDLAINKKIDDDEDRRNPQYIPKRGNFYEHDDRTLEEEEHTENENDETTEGSAKVEKDTPRSRKKVWEEKDGEKWGHDLYIEKEQQPKSKQELINAYGYDIRNEDGPPRARRRRRYGRGPNKYTRNWEDEEAYNRSTQIRTRKNPKNPPTAEDFPPLNPEKSQSVSPNRDRHNISNQNKNDGSGDPGSNRKERPPRTNKNWKKQTKNFEEKNAAPIENTIPQQREKPVKTPRASKSIRNEETYAREVIPKPQTPKNLKGSPTHGMNQAAPPKPMKYRQEEQIQTKIAPITSQSYSNSNRIKQQNTSIMSENLPKSTDVYEMTREMNNLSVEQQTTDSGNNSAHIQPPTNNINRQGSVPPRLQQQTEQQRMGPKRYSSLRQRSLPETTPQSFPMNSAGYYPQEYTTGNPQQGEAPHPIHQQMQMSPNPTPSFQPQIINAPVPNPSTLGLPMPHANAQVRGAHMTSPAGQPGPSVGGGPPSAHHQLLNAQSAMMAAAAAHTQVSHQQMLNAQPIITHALPQPTPHQPILTQAQGLPPQTQVMLNAQSQQLLTAQTHPQYGAPQYQVPSAGNASGVYNIQQAVNAGTTAFIPPQPNAVINSVYGQGPPGAQPPQYTPAPYPTYQPAYTAPPNQPPQDLYQTQGGITYYSPHNQPAAPKAPLKRPKAAIPILAPPERANAAPRGRGRSSPTENNTGSVTPPRGRGHISPSDNESYVSRGRGRKMSNDGNLDNIEHVSENVESVHEHSESAEAVSAEASIKASEAYSDVVEKVECENVAQNGTDVNCPN